MNTHINKQLHAVLAKHGIDDDTRRGLILQVTNGRTSSRREMTDAEGIKLCAMLNSQNLDSANRMRRKIIGMARELGWENPEGGCDMIRLNNWCCTYGKYKKVLQKHSNAELVQLIAQFEVMYLRQIKSKQ